MVFLVMAALAWVTTRIFCAAQNSVPRITAVEQNSVTKTAAVLPTDHEDSPDFIVETRDFSPTHFMTKIESFSLLSVYDIEKYETREFEAGDYKWRLVIYPNVHCQNKEKRNHISVYLAMVDTSSLPVNWEFNAIFTIFLYNQILDNYLCVRVNGTNGRRFNNAKSIWGFPKFISKKILGDESSGYIINDNIVLGAEVFVLKTPRVIESVNLFHPASQYPQKREWKIHEFSKLKADILFSEIFTIGDINWQMKLYPNGADPSSKGGSHLSIFLACVDSDRFDARKKVKTEFYIRLKCRGDFHHSEKFSVWFTSSVKDWGKHKFISLAALRDPRYGYLVDDCLTIEVEILVQLVE
ncbi:hypothetical protein ABFS82_10G134800 [Erythranthe guttata]